MAARGCCCHAYILQQHLVAWHFSEKFPFAPRHCAPPLAWPLSLIEYAYESSEHYSWLREDITESTFCSCASTLGKSSVPLLQQLTHPPQPVPHPPPSCLSACKVALAFISWARNRVSNLCSSLLQCQLKRREMPKSCCNNCTHTGTHITHTHTCTHSHTYTHIHTYRHPLPLSPHTHCEK